MSGEKQLAGSCRIESPAPLIFTPSPSFFVLPLSAVCISFHSLVKPFSFEFCIQRLTYPHTRPARCSAETLISVKRLFSLCSNAGESNELENAKRADEEVSGHKQHATTVCEARNFRPELDTTARVNRNVVCCKAVMLNCSHTKKNGSRGKKRNKTALPDAGDLLRSDWMTFLGEHRLTEPILP